MKKKYTDYSLSVASGYEGTKLQNLKQAIRRAATNDDKEKYRKRLENFYLGAICIAHGISKEELIKIIEKSKKKSIILYCSKNNNKKIIKKYQKKGVKIVESFDNDIFLMELLINRDDIFILIKDKEFQQDKFYKFLKVIPRNEYVVSAIVSDTCEIANTITLKSNVDVVFFADN